MENIGLDELKDPRFSRVLSMCPAPSADYAEASGILYFYFGRNPGVAPRRNEVRSRMEPPAGIEPATPSLPFDTFRVNHGYDTRCHLCFLFRFLAEAALSYNGELNRLKWSSLLEQVRNVAEGRYRMA